MYAKILKFLTDLLFKRIPFEWSARYCTRCAGVFKGVVKDDICPFCRALEPAKRKRTPKQHAQCKSCLSYFSAMNKRQVICSATDCRVMRRKMLYEARKQRKEFGGVVQTQTEEQED